MQAYALTLGKSGLCPNLHELKEDSHHRTWETRSWGIDTDGQVHSADTGHLSDFALALSGDLFKQIAWPTSVSALPDEFGLKLESQKAPIDILLIDLIEKPDAN